MSTATEADGPDPTIQIDWWAMLTDPEFLKNPYDDLNRIRAVAPVHLDRVSGIYFVLGHEEFRRMTTAPELGRDTRLWAQGWNSPENAARDPLGHALFSEFQPQMTNVNPPHHRRMRDVYENAFSAKRLAGFVPMMTAESNRLLDAAPVDEPVDFMAAFASPLASIVPLNIFGLPASLEDDVARWVAALSLLGNVIITPDQKRDAQTALGEFKASLRSLIASNEAPDDGFVGLTLAAVADGVMTQEEGLNNLVTLIAGGTATATLIGNGMLALLRHPAELAKLRGERTLMASAVEEMLRYEPGGSFILRVAIQDYLCGDTCIPAGSMAMGLVGAINRDGRRMDQPDVFSISRRPRPHITFGGGPHICIGKALVRMTAAAAFEALLDRFSNIELAGEPVWWTHRSDQHGLETLPLRLGHS